jgi:COX assembly mitochondrial protein 1
MLTKLCPTAFAACAQGRTFTLAFKCRETRRAMNGCMKIHSTPDAEDAAREEWFATRMERQKEREQKTRRKLEQEAFAREWWGAGGEEQMEERRRKEEERMRLGERVGGFAKRDGKDNGRRRDGAEAKAQDFRSSDIRGADGRR